MSPSPQYNIYNIILPIFLNANIKIFIKISTLVFIVHAPNTYNTYINLHLHYAKKIVNSYIRSAGIILRYAAALYIRIQPCLRLKLSNFYFRNLNIQNFFKKCKNMLLDMCFCIKIEMLIIDWYRCDWTYPPKQCLCSYILINLIFFTQITV